jgi:hypothetical protein
MNLFGQANLVPNYSFESYTTCPTTLGRIYFAYPWFQPNNAAESSDFFHYCNYPTWSSCSPYSYFGYQQPLSGNGYAGINLFNDTAISPDWNREYLEVGLNDTLIASHKYCIKLNVVKANLAMWAIKNIEVAFTNDSLNYFDSNGGYITGVSPILMADSVLTDTLNWIQVFKTYSAFGGERFLTIGNFSPGASVQRKLVLPYSMGTTGYYLFDDISVYELPDYNAGNDTTICPWHSTVIGPQTARADVTYSWSPSTGLSDPNAPNPVASPLINTTYILTVTDTSQWACSSTLNDTIKITVTGCVGIDESVKLDNVFNIFPNPATNSLTIETSKNISFITILNIQGQEVLTVPINSKFTNVDLHGMSQGVYYLQNGLTRKILIIQR